MIENVLRDRRSIGSEKTMSQFSFRGSPTNAQQNLVVSEPPSPTSANMAVVSTVLPGARSASPSSATSNGPTNTRCCETGRPLFSDPITGQSVCSCQYDLMNYQRLASVGISTGSGAIPLSMYNAPYSAEAMAAYFPALGGEQSSFYPNPAAASLDLKENLSGSPWPYPPVYPAYDAAALAGYHFNGYPMDLNGARRKNATRETTSTLKAWLNEHKKNPYPTKGEKIMLAIITKMTLTQVSTWFANARRRLKKENKMTWEPRNRVEDDDINLDDDDHKSNDEKDMLDSGTGSSEDGDRPSRIDLDGPSSVQNEWNESRNESGPDSPDIYDRAGPLFQTHHAVHNLRNEANPNQTPSGSTNPTISNKPRIWSLADMASKENKNEGSSTNSSLYSATGKFHSPLAARGLHNLHHPYIRTDLYRNLYSLPHDASLLETYQRTLNTTLNNNGINPNVPLSALTKPPAITTTPLHIPISSASSDAHLLSSADLRASSPNSSVSSGSESAVAVVDKQPPSESSTSIRNMSKP